MSDMHDVTSVIQRSSNSELPKQDRLSNGCRKQQQDRQHQTFQQECNRNVLNNSNTDNNNNNNNYQNKSTNIHKKIPPPVPVKQFKHKSDVLIRTQTIASNDDLSIKSDKFNKVIVSSSSSSSSAIIEKNNAASAIKQCNKNDSLPIQDNLNRQQQQQHQNMNDNKGQSNNNSILYKKSDDVCCSCSEQFNSRISDACHNGKHFLCNIFGMFSCFFFYSFYVDGYAKKSS